MSTSLSRREFLRKSGFAASIAPAIAASSILSTSARSQAAVAGANSKLRLGVIGCGGMGQGDLNCFFLNPEVDCAVIADIDDSHLAAGRGICEKKGRPTPDLVKDFRRVLDRKDVDAVLIATPDHWHAIPTVQACQAGKDVYVEKPLAKTIGEGRAMLEASRRHNRVVQMGSQWRSCKHIIEATDLIRSGKLGKVSVVRGWAYLDWLKSIGRPADCPPPAGVDYEMWLGPAPERPFNPNRFHFNFRWFWDYAGGLMTDWGVHLINMMMMGVGNVAPQDVFSTGGKFVFDDASETPDSQVTVYRFPSFTLIWEHKAGLNNGLNNRSWGVEWNGTEGTIILNDEGYQIITERSRANLDSGRKPGSGDPRPAHVRNFLDCVQSRQQPALNLEIGHQVSTVAHLGNIAYRTGRKVVWDSEHEKIVGDHEADRMVTARYRKPWKLDYLRHA
ncbi:MAG TPA: Gfo/Idh/MocA family oxidoreductase [Verrucomicrobiae bacterium]|nr:Gfo/Idh/MocA family oxidoreductase [Verrucomicrobiae bacterium]